ncbi:hypothetical protein DH2020_012222 [Rehmannia glutinosa]|uniref:Cytochrome P450 protein n=1 Tax=Rehmannia glutinosa TaxID=99300 RepID=A0ABR0X040_REHGL
MFLVWFGSTAHLIISDPALIKEILVLKSEFFEKDEPPLLVKRIEGNGLLNLKGQKWAQHRKVIQPIFHTENLKVMIPMMAKSMEEALMKWSEKMSNIGKVEIEVSDWFQNLVEDVITRATFGSSYEAGRAIFQLQAEQIVHAAEAYHKVYIPGYRNSEIVVESHRRSKDEEEGKCELSGGVVREECPRDLLELMIKAADEPPQSKESLAVTENDIVEECKTFFFAGKQTTSNLLTWTAVLLAMHPQWQEQAREELGMILNESLRLYPPAVAIIRQAKTNVQLGGLHIPRGTELIIPILAVHHDPVLWHHDAQEFNPARFATGAAQAAKHPMAFMPFGLGSRRCIGQNLAVQQAKLAIAMILQRFSFELAPDYAHAPSVVMLLHPQHGAPLVFRKL